MIKSVEAEIIKWRRYFKDDHNLLGFPTCTTDSKMNEGGLSSDNKGAPAPDPYVPEDVAVMEIIMRRLYQKDREARPLVEKVYMTGESSREEQARWLGKELSRTISVTKLKEMIHSLHVRIEGVYDGIEIFIGKKY